MTNRELRAELTKYCLENYENGFDVVIETWDEMEWAYIIGKAHGSFSEGVKLLKEETEDYVAYRAEIQATAF